MGIGHRRTHWPPHAALRRSAMAIAMSMLAAAGGASRSVSRSWSRVAPHGSPIISSSNGFDPFIVDGHDPAAVARAILEAERRLQSFAEDAAHSYPAPVPYVIAETAKGFVRLI